MTKKVKLFHSNINDFDEFDRKVISQFMLDQQTIINALTETNQKLSAENKVLLGELDSQKLINKRILVNRELNIRVGT
jgi:predicted signal transduction protein with EAL and GGDEF domain|tara:strand:- start:8230 stop:8463 length:234 start_codon:yes stop_codon:yes gene_type:complete